MKEPPGFAKQRYISVFDGNVAKSYLPPDATYGMGGGGPAKANGEFFNIYLMPPIMHYRALSPLLGQLYQVGDYQLRSGSATINGRKCIMLERVRVATGSTNLYYIDPERDFTLARYTRKTGDGLLETQVTTSFQQDSPSHGWVPSSWTAEHFRSSGSVSESAVSTVVSYAINPPLRMEDFQLEFPPGTHVTEASPTGGIAYIMREGGMKRIITLEEGGATYEQFPNSESGMALSQPDSGSGAWPRWKRILILSGICSGAFFLAAVLIYQTARRRWDRMPRTH